MIYEQLVSHTQHFVPYATVCLCSSFTDFFHKFNKFKPLKSLFRDFSLSANLALKFRHVIQLWTEVQFHKAVNTKSLKFKAFSPDTAVIEQEQDA